MAKLFGFIIAAIWWLWIVLSATGVSVLIGLGFAYLIFDERYYVFSIVFAVTGVIVGILWAEKTRKKTGLDKFYGAVTGAPTKDQSMKRENT